MISVIIPVINEEKVIEKTLEELKDTRGIEAIVVDGGSTDRTAQIVNKSSLKFVQTIKCRSQQMNEGAKIAEGDILFFLHADCKVEKNVFDTIKQCIKEGYIGGCLSQKIDSQSVIFRLIEASGNIRAKLTRVFYGDQGIFVRKDIFDTLKGFEDVELLEDVIFSKKMKKAGKTCCLNEKILVSPRRWQKQGIIKTSVINWIVSLGFILGKDPSYLKRYYKETR